MKSFKEFVYESEKSRLQALLKKASDPEEYDRLTKLIRNITETYIKD